LKASIAGKVAYNTAVQLAGKAVGMGVAVVSIAVLTRYLGPEDYGRYALALMLVGVLGVLADVGLFTTVVRDISRAPERTETLVGNAMTLRLVLSLAVIALATAVALVLPYDRTTRVAIVLAGAPLLLGLLQSSLLTVLQARLLMDRAALADVIGRFAGLGLVVLVAGLDLGFYAVMGAAAGATAATLAVTWAFAGRLIRIRFLADPAVWRQLLAASVPLGLALAINELYFRADAIVISLFRDYGEVGLYSLAYRILELLIVVGPIFLTSVFPLLSRYAAGGDARLTGVIQRAWDVFVIAGLPMAVGGALLAPQIVELAGGADFAGSVAPLRILFAAGALSFVNGLFGYALIAMERQKRALWLNVAGLSFNVGLNLILVPPYGITAAAIVTVASEILIIGGSYVLMRRHLHFFPTPGTLAPAAVAAAAMTAALWPVRDGSLFLLAPLGALLYGGLITAISPRFRALARELRS
jgi:O-antigen/teichoic acid export membrane protein